MAESVLTIVGEIAAERMVDSIATRVDYIRNYKANFENLDKQVKNLQGRRDEVQHKVVEATRNGDEIHKHVQNWLDRVNNMIEEVTDIIEDNKRQNMRCFKSLCPDLKKRYQQSKIARMKTDDVSKLHNEGTFDRVSYRTLPAEIWLPDSYENINSRHSIVEGILDALQDRDVNMIGVHGMGGSGKTTLVREVAKKAEEDKLFNRVVFAEVSDTVDIRKIQVVIAERLGLEFREDSETIRADRLRNRIIDETKILLILDNIWKDLDLAVVGIPFGNNHVGCKLLLTSRDMDLLKEMGSKSNFFVDVLEEEEACNLFMQIAGVGEEQHGLRSSAFDVAKACGGLLVAIFTVAKALKNKEQCDWDTALRKLNNPPSFENVEGSVLKKAYMSIYLSYENLESEELKSTFLLCSIMACTHHASIEQLLRYAVGLRLFKENTMEDEREKAKELVRKLKDSSLLLGTRNSETFSIHDVIRDVGRWIAHKDQHKFTVIDDVIPRQWADENTLQNCTSIILHDILELPKPLECPQLQFFYMKTKTPFTKIPGNFFEGMPNLIVLHLIEMYLSPLPASLCLLKKLRTLNLGRCHLEDMAEMKDMENLEILVIGFGSDEQLLPKEIGRLNRLRVLDLRNCSFIIPPKTISRLTQLEELYMGDWYDQRKVEGSVASLEELKDLSQLTALHIRVADAEILPKGLDFFKKLKRYNIVIGEPITFYFSRETLRTFSVKSDTNMCSEDGVIKQLKGIEDLRLDGEQRVKNVLYELDGEGFPQLKRFHMKNNPYIQYIVDSIPSATCEAFPLLETLSLEKLVRLEEICHDQLRAKCFCQLTTIEVKECGKLKNLFSFSIAKHLSQLQKIEVVDCGNMEEIFSIGRTDDVNNNEVVCDQLHSLTLSWLPRLRRICSESGITSTSQERLMPLTTDASDALPLFGEKVVFPNLTTLSVWRCDNLKYLFSSSTLGSLKQLQHLKIYDCKELEELIRIDDNCSNYVEFPSLEKLDIKWCPEIREFIFSDKVSFPSLQEIGISYMNNLKMIWQNQLIESVQYCPKLCNMELHYCRSLKNLFPASITRRLLQLEKLHVSDCGIKEIVSKEERVDQEEAARFVFPRLSSLKLCSLKELGCFYPGKRTTEWPKLRELKVEENGEKIDLFNFQKNNEDQPDVPVQQHLFMVDKAFSNLEKLTISRNHFRTICQSSYPKDLFPNLEFLELIGLSLNLEFLEVTDDESAVFLVDILVRFHNLKKLILTSGWYEAVFSFEEVEKHARTLAQIKSLCIKNRDDLKQLWKSPSASFENLKFLKVSRCYRLLSLVVASTAKSLVRLEEMGIEYCSEMTEIIANEGDVLEGEIIFRSLKSLELVGLSNLTCFCSGNYTLSFPLLEKLTMASCPKMQFFSSGVLITPKLKQVSQNWRNYDLECDNLNTVIKQHLEKEIFSKSILSGDDIRLVWQMFPERMKVFSNAKQLNLNGNDIGMIQQSQFPEHIFPKLKCLEVSLDKSTVFPFGIFQISHNVAKLVLKYSSYKEIFPHEEVQKHEGELPQIKCLPVTKLHDLEQMWKPNSELDLILINLEILEVKWCNSLTNVLLPSSSFENLKILKVEGCERLISLVAASIAKCMVQLEEMQICRCKMMTEVVANEGDIIEEEKIIFHKLKKLEFNYLSSLTSFSSGNYTFKIPVLEKLEVKECPKMMIFSSRDLDTPMLREVWQDQTEYTCENDLNKIVQQHHEEMVFSKSILSGDDIRLVWQMFPERTKVFYNAKQLNLDGNDVTMIWQSRFLEHIFPKVKCLEVSMDKSMVFPFGIFQKIFHNVAKLVLNYSSYKEIFPHEEVQKHEGELPQIKCLRVTKLHDLEQMWKPNSKLDLILINLEILEVQWCKSLTNVLLPSSSFENIKILKVEGCERLISLVAASTAKCMVQLEEMQICWCKMMTEVVANEGDITEEDKIIFHKLKKLELNDLSSLTSFSSGNYTFKIPLLEKLNVKECPNMKIFSSRDLNTPMLREVWQDQKEYVCENDLNTIIQHHHEETVFSREKLHFESIRIILQKFVDHHKVFSNLEQLSFSRDEIKMLWQSKFPQRLFPKLELLEVSGDESIVFQLAILERFQNVKTLELNYGSYEEILSCKDVEKHAGTLAQIKSLSLYRLDDLKQMWKQHSKMDLNLQNLETLKVECCGSLVTLMPPSASFQNLRWMSVEGCHRLMSFLAPSTAKSLVQLVFMTIKKSNMMTEVISSNEGSETRDEIIFEKLWSLDLDDLSSLTSFCSGKYTFSFPCLDTLTVEKCPKIKNFSSGVLNTPELNRIRHDGTYYILDGDLNATIHGIHEKLNTKNSTEDCAGPSALSPSSSAI